MSKPIFDTLVTSASVHHGYVTTLQARDLGIDPTQLRLLASRGRLEHVARGVYRVPVLPRCQHDEMAFAVAWARGRAVISHESALFLHHLSDVNPSVVHLTTPPDNYPRAGGGGLKRVHRRALPTDEVTTVDGLPVTTVLRTLADCHGMGTDSVQLLRAIDRARKSGRLTSGQALRLAKDFGLEARGSHVLADPVLTPRRIVSPVELGLMADVEGLARVCDHYGIAELLVFGSAVTRTMTPDSDLDLLYVLREGVHLGWELNDLSDDLSGVLGRHVDLVAKDGLHARLRDSVLGEAQVLYAA